MKILQGHCTRLILHRGLGKRPPCNAWPEPIKVLFASRLQSPWRCCQHHSHQHQPGLRPTRILGIHKPKNIPSCTALKTLSQKRMKNSKAPETTKLVISSTQVCLTLICYYCTSWTMEALPCCQTWKPHIRESQSFSKIILWEAEGLWNDSFEIFPTVQKNKKKLDF